MFAVRLHHGRALYSPRLPRPARPPRSPTNPRVPFSTPFSTCPHSLASNGNAASSRYPDKATMQPHGPLAEQLAATGMWRAHSEGRGTTTQTRKKKIAGDKTRINIVNEKLCDDILSYIGHSLERHRGCDLVDLYPGAGLWSSKLHDFLQPRTHVFLEPDAELYRPFLQPLLDKPGTTLAPISGIIWRELSSILTPESLPHQVVPDDTNVRNDTLLVTANLSFHPKKRFLNFESIAALVLHQFVDSIRHSSLFQRYGLVRMLIWARTDDKLSFIPRNMQRRRRQAIENEFVCEYVREVCGGEEAAGGWYVREHALDVSSALGTMMRMKAAGLELPAGRESSLYREVKAAAESGVLPPPPGSQIPTFRRLYQTRLKELEAANAKEKLAPGSQERKELSHCRWRTRADKNKAERMHSMLKRLDDILDLHKNKAAAEEIAAAEYEWNEETVSMNKTFSDEFVTYKDNVNALRRSPPLLEWDRRAYEPMTVESTEFFPNIHCSLLDIQPKAPHPLLRQAGSSTSRAADMLDMILGMTMQSCTQPIGTGLDSLWPGAADYILPRWTSGQDLAQGAVPLDLRYAGLGPRQLNARQWEELLELWMQWPFHPEFHDLVGRTQEESADRFDDTLSSDVS